MCMYICIIKKEKARTETGLDTQPLYTHAHMVELYLLSLFPLTRP